MKRSELIFNFVSLPVDVVMLFISALLSFYIRFHSTDLVGPVIYQLSVRELALVAVNVVPIQLLIFALVGLYNLKGTRKFSSEFGRVTLGISVGLFLVIILFFFRPQLFPSRFIILSVWAFGIVLVLLGRLLLRYLQLLFFYRGYGLHKLVIINGQNQESRVIRDMLKDKKFGYEVVTEIDYSSEVIQNLESIYVQRPIDEIMQANPGVGDKANLELVMFAKSKGVSFSFIPNLFDVQRNAVEITNFQQIPVISIKNTPLDGWGKVAKRTLDIFASSVCLLITSPLFLILAVGIKLDSSGKIIYAALRGGRGKDFWFYKFRSMYTHFSVGEGYGGVKAEQVRQELWKKNDRGGEDGPFLKIKDDPRVTRMGKFLRRSKLDELPQFWNVLKGDMSMVGPRAHVLDEVDRYRNRYRRMFSIKPGIFGMSQIAQVTWPDLPFEEEIRLNTYYIENWSLWLDIKILARSFYLLFFAKKPKGDY